MNALLLDRDQRRGIPLQRAGLSDGHDEPWLQRLLLDHPELIPLEQIDWGSGRFIPVCRELRLPKPGGAAFLDLFGVTTSGRPVLIECKLWRNPQARREVVAQLLEYAALLRRWTYADLTMQLRKAMSSNEADPLYTSTCAHLAQPPLESRFVDAVSRYLRTGDFHLIIAGDGIREDLAAISDHLIGQGTRLTLLEIQLWADEAGRTLVVPQIALRTEVLRQRLIEDAAGHLMQIEAIADGDDPSGDLINPRQTGVQAENRAFWQRFVDSVHFDHPDQPSPRHGNKNNVRIPLPAPARWLTAYRSASDGNVGMYLGCEEGSTLCAEVARNLEVLREETGLPSLGFGLDSSGRDIMIIARPMAGLGGDDGMLTWLGDTANRLVNALRPRLAAL
jgi:hypothetical protein